MVKTAANPRPAPRSGQRAAARGSAAAPLPAVRPGYYKGQDYRVQESVGYLMKQVVELLSRALESRMAAYGLTDAQWRPLFMLAQHGTHTAAQVARMLGCDAGATTRMLDRLEDKGLLQRVRSTDDRRVVELELTDAGAQAAAIVPYVIADVLNEHLAELSHGDIDQLRVLLQRIVATGRGAAAQRENQE